MATGIENYPNIEAPDSDYPNGNIKDEGLSLPGTPVNKLVYADSHQTLAKFLRTAEITANGLPDNDYNGYQYYDAMGFVLGNHKQLVFNKATGAGILVEGDYNPTVVITKEAGAGNYTTIQEPSGSYIANVFIANYSQHSSDVLSFGGGNINGAVPPYTISVGDAVKFKYNVGSLSWDVVEKFKLDI